MNPSPNNPSQETTLSQEKLQQNHFYQNQTDHRETHIGKIEYNMIIDCTFYFSQHPLKLLMVQKSVPPDWSSPNLSVSVRAKLMREKTWRLILQQFSQFSVKWKENINIAILSG